MRLLLADRLNGGILAALMAYALLFQAIGGGIAGARMVEASLQVAGVLCATGGPAHHGDGHRSGECCAVLCQAACATGLAIAAPPGDPPLGMSRAAAIVVSSIGRTDLSSPRHLGLTREARAPPHLPA